MCYCCYCTSQIYRLMLRVCFAVFISHIWLTKKDTMSTMNYIIIIHSIKWYIQAKCRHRWTSQLQGCRAVGISDRWLALIQEQWRSLGWHDAMVALPTSLRAPFCVIWWSAWAVSLLVVQKEGWDCLALVGHSWHWRTHLSPYCQPPSILDTTGMAMVSASWVANVSVLCLEICLWVSLFQIHFCKMWLFAQSMSKIY